MGDIVVWGTLWYRGCSDMGNDVVWGTMWYGVVVVIWAGDTPCSFSETAGALHMFTAKSVVLVNLPSQ